MTRYELVLVLPSSGAEQDRTATVERFESVITKNGGSLEEQKSWGKRRLAYPINKDRDGYYFQIDFTAEPTAPCLAELDRELRIAEDLLRFLITKAVVGKSKGKPPSPEDMAKMNYRPPGSRRPPMGGGRDRDAPRPYTPRTESSGSSDSAPAAAAAPADNSED